MRFIFVLALALISLNSFAGGGWAELKPDDYLLWPGTYGKDKIRVQLVDDAGLAIDPGGCATDGAFSYYVQSTLSQNVINRIYSLLLATKMAKQSLRIYVAGCEDGFPAIQSLQF